jgi:hypothetical protein
VFTGRAGFHAVQRQTECVPDIDLVGVLPGLCAVVNHYPTAVGSVDAFHWITRSAAFAERLMVTSIAHDANTRRILIFINPVVRKSVADEIGRESQRRQPGGTENTTPEITLLVL